MFPLGSDTLQLGTRGQRLRFPALLCPWCGHTHLHPEALQAGRCLSQAPGPRPQARAHHPPDPQLRAGSREHLQGLLQNQG